MRYVQILIAALVLSALLLVGGSTSRSLGERASAAPSGISAQCQASPSLKNCVEHIVVLMQENRSFDHYFGRLGVYDPTLRDGGDNDLLDEPVDYDNTVNLNPSGGPPIHAYHKTLLCDSSDTNHGWNGTHWEWFHDLPENFTVSTGFMAPMDGFTSENSNVAYNAATAPNGNRSDDNKDPHDVNGRRAIGYYTEDELPFYYKLYSTFAISDRYFQSALTQTFPNRFYLLAGTSWVDNSEFAETRNRIPGVEASASGQPMAGPDQMLGRSIFNLLDGGPDGDPLTLADNISWKVYYSEAVLTFPNEFAFVREHSQNVVPVANYTADAQSGNLPDVAFIDPILIGGARNVQNDEHAPNNVQLGQQFVSDRINDLMHLSGTQMQTPSWSSTVFFLTYDEHGGYFDRVPPTAAVAPDAHAPRTLDTRPDPDEQPLLPWFDRYGIRVPVVAVSPFAKKHYVSHPGWTTLSPEDDVSYDHTSILRFIEKRFDLPTVNENAGSLREKAADQPAEQMLDFFDFANPPFADPPDTTGSYPMPPSDPLPASDPRLPPAPPADLTRPECRCPDSPGGPEPPCQDFDGDNDGAPNPFDNCPDLSNSPSWPDYDGDGVGGDAAGTSEVTCDNCPTVPNGTAEGEPVVHDPVRQIDVVNQTDSDADSHGDACDNCPTIINGDQANFDGDTLGDACDADDDNDLVNDIDEGPCGAAPLNAVIKPERLDTSADDDGDTLVNEPLPGGSSAFDCDGDGWRGNQENLIFSDAPGTARDQDPCGNNGWPADLDPDNKLNIGDINSFTTPNRPNAQHPYTDGHGLFNKFGHPLDDANNGTGMPPPDGLIDPLMARWNLDNPPHLAGTTIDIGDLNAINPGITATTARPPMSGGQPAFFTNGGMCPYAP